MTQLKLTYFDVDGGRGEPIRLALHIGGIEFEDYRFPYSAFLEEREKTPLGQVPVLDVDGTAVTQSNAILRYVGKQTELYPSDLYQALICDEIMDVAEDCINSIVSTFQFKGDELKVAREKLVDEDLAKYLKFIESKLALQGGDYFADHRLTIADLKIFPIIGWLNSGSLEYIPMDLVEKVAPQLNKHLQQISKEAKVVAYYQARK
ncbi:glutathione S-transferase [Thalassotalea piscium]